MESSRAEALAEGRGVSFSGKRGFAGWKSVSGNNVLEDDVQSRPFYEPQFFGDRAGGGAEMRSAPYHPALANVAKLCNLKHAFRRIQPYKQNGSYSTCRASCYCTTLGGLTMQPTFNGLLFNKPTIVSAQPPKC